MKMRSARGFTLVEVMVGVGLIGISFAALAALAVQFASVRKTSDIARTLSKYRNVLVDDLSSYSGWQATTSVVGMRNGARAPDVEMQDVSNAAALGCVRGGLIANRAVVCAAATSNSSSASFVDAPDGPLISVVNGDNDVIFNSKTPTNGFDASGLNCRGFNDAPGAGNDACPFRYDVRVRIVCKPATPPATAADCSIPQVVVSGKLRYNPSPRSQNTPVNVDKYSFNFVRGLDSNSVLVACQTAAGIYQAGPPPTCILPLVGSCPPGQYVAGILAEPGQVNRKYCRPVVGVCQNPGEVMVALGADGTPVCEPSACAAFIPLPTATPEPPPPATCLFGCDDGTVVTDGTAPVVTTPDGGDGGGGDGGGGDGGGGDGGGCGAGGSDGGGGDGAC